MPHIKIESLAGAKKVSFSAGALNTSDQSLGLFFSDTSLIQKLRGSSKLIEMEMMLIEILNKLNCGR